MNILFDHGVPKRLRKSFAGHHIRTTRDMGWQQFRNGLLLSRAATSFDLVITTDKNIRHQQNLAQLPLPVVELNGIDGRLKSLLVLSPYFEEAIQQTLRYKFVAVLADGQIECLAERSAAT